MSLKIYYWLTKSSNNQIDYMPGDTRTWLFGNPVFAASFFTLLAFGIWYSGLPLIIGIPFLLLLIHKYIMWSIGVNGSWSSQEVLGVYLIDFLLILGLSMSILLVVWLISKGTFITLGLAIVLVILLLLF